MASIHASYPRKEETDDDGSLSSDSYFYIENEDIKMESDSYSIESNDERKRPAKRIIKARRQLRIKREEEEEEIVLPSAPSVVNEDVTPPHDFNQKEEVFNEVAILDWIKGENAPMLRPTWVRQEGYDYFDSDEYETDQEYDSTESEDEAGSQSKGRRSYDNPSYFDKTTARKDNDEEDPSSSPKTGGVRRCSSMKHISVLDKTSNSSNEECM